MTEIIVTSSALILALLLLRRVFRQKISRRVQYALWGLVLVRLLVPASLPAAEFSVLSTARPVLSELDGTALYIEPMQERVEAVEGDSGRPATASAYRFAAMGPPSEDNTRTFTDENRVTHEISYARQINLEALLRPVWYAGVAVMACWLVFSNLRFWRKLRRSRIPLELEGCTYPVYLVEEELPSPCLFGLVRPSIYLTPAALETEEGARHVIAHESTHARHLDPLWSLLRGVCLAVHWFNPLVWWAAVASRVDCELACDEGALRRLGEDARVAYGQTLLRLIPVQRTNGSPLLTATTMTADKKRLADRITRIAENRKTRKTALCAAAALAVLICAVTFTGGGGKKRPLTAGELAWFNEYFFAGTRQENIRRCFLYTPYDAPEEINLPMVFYYSGSEISSDEEAALGRQSAQSLAEGFVSVKLTPAHMDAVLRQYTGLGLEETEMRGLVQPVPQSQPALDVTYLPEYDAYYFPSCAGGSPSESAVMRAGEREGDLIRLYYTYGGGDAYYDWWYCVTLEDRGDNRYWFVSNQICREAIPAIPTVYPDTPGPVETIPLDRVMPYAPPDAEPVRRLEADEMFSRVTGGPALEHRIAICLARDEHYYLVRLDEGEWPTGGTVFFQLPGTGNYSLFMCYNLLGCAEGISVSYSAQEENYGTTYTDYYALDGDNLTLLLRARGMGQPIDLDGDGDYELASSDGWRYAQIFYQRGDTLYCADLSELLPRSWPAARYMEFAQWDRTRRCLPLWGSVALPGQEAGDMGGATAFREIYFDGESLLMYKSGRSPAMDLPAYVDEAASAIAQDRMAWWQRNTGAAGGDGAPVGEPAEWDAWRFTAADKLDSAYYGQLPEGLEVEVYDFAYELHTTTPEKVILAGGTYIDEDGWVGGFYEEDRFLVFWRNPARGRFERLGSCISSDASAGSDAFQAGLAWTLVRAGAMELDALSAETLFNVLQDTPTAFLEGLAVFPGDQRLTALEKLMTHPKIAACLSEMAGWDTSWFSDSALETLEQLRAMPLG